MKDHEKRELINAITAVAVKYAGAQQLREQIAHLVIPALIEPRWWESTTEVYTKYITDDRYRKLKPDFQKWYRPMCGKCNTPNVK